MCCSQNLASFTEHMVYEGSWTLSSYDKSTDKWCNNSQTLGTEYKSSYVPADASDLEQDKKQWYLLMEES